MSLRADWVFARPLLAVASLLSFLRGFYPLTAENEPKIYLLGSIVKTEVHVRHMPKRMSPRPCVSDSHVRLAVFMLPCLCDRWSSTKHGAKLHLV